MAKLSTILLLLSSILVADQATAAATQSSPAVEKSNGDINLELQKIMDAVVSAAPPTKQKETQQAALKHIERIKSALTKAKESGDDKKIDELAFGVTFAGVVVSDAPPDKKLKVMEETFNSMAAPDPQDCPTVDKAFCETNFKIHQAFEGVVAAAPIEKRLEVRSAVLKNQINTAMATINKAYADGDEKKIAQVLAAYNKATGEVIAAAPADRLNVMEKTFDAAAGN